VKKREIPHLLQTCDFRKLLKIWHRTSYPNYQVALILKRLWRYTQYFTKSPWIQFLGKS